MRKPNGGTTVRLARKWRAAPTGKPRAARLMDEPPSHPGRLEARPAEQPAHMAARYRHAANARDEVVNAFLCEPTLRPSARLRAAPDSSSPARQVRARSPPSRRIRRNHESRSYCGGRNQRSMPSLLRGPASVKPSESQRWRNECRTRKPLATCAFSSTRSWSRPRS